MHICIKVSLGFLLHSSGKLTSSCTNSFRFSWCWKGYLYKYGNIVIEHGKLHIHRKKFHSHDCHNERHQQNIIWVLYQPLIILNVYIYFASPSKLIISSLLQLSAEVDCTIDQTYGMKNSSGWSSSTYRNLSSGNFLKRNRYWRKVYW